MRSEHVFCHEPQERHVTDFDVCVVGSGAGGAPIAYAAAKAGRSVVVLEKGPWLREGDFFKDEVAECRRRKYLPDLRAEPHVVAFDDGSAWPTHETGWDFWNGSLVGGATNLMSGYFHRLKPVDFRLLSEFGPIDGAAVTDWPITYADLEPWYAHVERVVGISGRVVKHRQADTRSTPNFPMPPLAEHPVSGWLDEAAAEVGAHTFPVPRAILSLPTGGRRGCEYSGYCGSYGCSSGAKGSARAALIDAAVATGRCEVRPNSMVAHLASDARGRVTHAEYFDAAGVRKRVDARVFVVACQPIESARLLLNSRGPGHPEGLGNRDGQVGRFLLSSAGGSGSGTLTVDRFGDALGDRRPFVNRATQVDYVLDDPRRKGGTVDFLWRHPNPISRAQSLAWGSDGPLWGWAYKEKLRRAFKRERELMFEVFCDWLPVPGCNIALDPDVVDRWGLPVARVTLEGHPQNIEVGKALARRGESVLRALGADDVSSRTTWSPSTNLLAGGCRFGADPATSALDRDCRMHHAPNVYVTDGSFAPTGGSVPYTWTIYANAFRVADRLLADA